MSEEVKNHKPAIIGIIINPVQQFERIKKKPKIWGAMLVVIILTALGGWLTAMNVEIPDLEGMGDAGAVGTNTIAGITSIVVSIIIVLITVLITSAIYMLIAKIAQSTVRFKQLFSMSTYIYIITALGATLNGIIVAIVGGSPEVMATSLGSIIQAKGAMGGLWDSIEVFSVWNFILTALGLQIVAGFSKKLAWTIVIVFFVITVSFAMISSYLATTIGV